MLHASKLCTLLLLSILFCLPTSFSHVFKCCACLTRVLATFIYSTMAFDSPERYRSPRMLIVSHLTLFHRLVSPPQQILDHMNESAIYNESDLAPFTRRLEQLRKLIKHDAESGKHPVAMTKLLERQLGECGGYITCSSVMLSIPPFHHTPIPCHTSLPPTAAPRMCSGCHTGHHALST